MKFTGYINPNNWNKDKKVFEIKTLGQRDNGAILAGLSVSSKDKDGKTIYGQPVDVKIIIKSEDEGKRTYDLVADRDTPILEFDGFFAPNNWTNSEGREFKGHQIVITDSASIKVYAKPKVETKQVDDAPFETKPADNKRDIPDW